MRPVLVRRETAADVAAVDALTRAAFGREDEARILRELRETDAWLPALSLVAGDVIASVTADRAVTGVIGHGVCTRARLGGRPALGLGPLSVDPAHQRRGVGSALMHAVLAAADALDEPVVVLLGDPAYYERFGFVLADGLGIVAPLAEWRPYLQARPLSAYTADLQGSFEYAEPLRPT